MFVREGEKKLVLAKDSTSSGTLRPNGALLKSFRRGGRMRDSLEKPVALVIGQNQVLLRQHLQGRSAATSVSRCLGDPSKLANLL